ncbi:MAG: hypothetical protein IR158_12525 [Cellulomonas sp.]|uniref:hypothetical protein n=1 Tax=Cellulomonas sp. TaxID=40001 RepID=UPI001A02CCF5|nr:hypothetical protein [Cellulomonas sp.]MBF0688574.1 hypothetical protein [Cellulomonas sp.]
MTSTAPTAAKTHKRRGPGREILYRALLMLWALTLLVLFGTWRSILTPWVAFQDTADHGWDRTAELHRLADSASAVLMVAIAAASVVLVTRPAHRSGMAAWIAGSLAAVGLAVPVSGHLQGHAAADGLITAGVWLALTAVTFVVVAPDGRAVARGGLADGSAPPAHARLLLAVGGIVGIGAALTAVVWRSAGGVFESAREDDVVGFVLLGLSFALGCRLCQTGREGWRALCVILACVAGYVLVGGMTLALP